MRLVSFREPQQHNIQWGVDLGGEIFVPNRDPRWQPNIDSMLTLIDAGSDALVTLTALLEDVRPDYCVAMAQIELLAPIPRPRQNVICLGLK